MTPITQSVSAVTITTAYSAKRLARGLPGL